MFERFTDRARQVVVHGQAEARALKHNYIGTEHLLLGLLLVEDGVAAKALSSLEVTAEDVRGQIARIVGVGDEVDCAPGGARCPVLGNAFEMMSPLSATPTTSSAANNAKTNST